MKVLLLNFGYEVVLRKLARSRNLKVKLACFIYELDFTFSGWRWFSLIYDFGSFWVIFDHLWDTTLGGSRSIPKNKIKSCRTQIFFVFSCKASLTLPATPKSPSQTRWNAQTVQKDPEGVFVIFRISVQIQGFPCLLELQHGFGQPLTCLPQ